MSVGRHQPKTASETTVHTCISWHLAKELCHDWGKSLHWPSQHGLRHGLETSQIAAVLPR